MKKIGISSNGNDLNSLVSTKFGQSPYVCIIEWDNNQIADYKFVATANLTGLEITQTLANEGIEALVTGDIGNISFNDLGAQGIDVYNAQNLAIKDIANDYFANKLAKIKSSNTPGRGYGSRGGRGQGQGGPGGQGGNQGQGRGQGGQGRGQGPGKGQGRQGGNRGQGRGRNQP